MKNLILVLGMFLISVPGCKMTGTVSSNGKPGSNSTEQSSKAVDSKEALASAFKKLRNVPFATVKIERTGDMAATIIEQYSAANSSYSKKTEVGESFEKIIIGPESFSRQNSFFPWRKESDYPESADKAFFSIHNYLAEKVIPSSEVKSGGEETLNGKTAAVYNISLAERDSDIPALIRIWIGKETGLPMKIYKEFRNGNKMTDTFDYESAVNIERPAVDKK